MDGVKRRALGLVWLVLVHDSGHMWRRWCCHVILFSRSISIQWSSTRDGFVEELVRLCSPPLSGWSRDYPLALISDFSMTMIYPIHGHHCLLVYIDDFPSSASTSLWVWTRLLRWDGGLETVMIFFHDTSSMDAEGTQCWFGKDLHVISYYHKKVSCEGWYLTYGLSKILACSRKKKDLLGSFYQKKIGLSIESYPETWYTHEDTKNMSLWILNSKYKCIMLIQTFHAVFLYTVKKKSMTLWRKMTIRASRYSFKF